MAKDKKNLLGDAVSKKQERRQGGVARELPQDLVVPEQLPRPGDRVVFVYGDTNLVGSPKIEMLMFVTSASKNGLVNGYMMPDPAMGLQQHGPGGRPVPLPPLMPVAQAPYSPRVRGKLTWHWGIPDNEGRTIPGDAKPDPEDYRPAEPWESNTSKAAAPAEEDSTPAKDDSEDTEAP